MSALLPISLGVVCSFISWGGGWLFPLPRSNWMFVGLPIFCACDNIENEPTDLNSSSLFPLWRFLGGGGSISPSRSSALSVARPPPPKVNMSVSWFIMPSRVVADWQAPSYVGLAYSVFCFGCCLPSCSCSWPPLFLSVDFILDDSSPLD